jgi:putative ABC transport system substrate-binding protein
MPGPTSCKLHRSTRMHRRTFLTCILAVIPPHVKAQARLPIVGFLRSTAQGPFKHLVIAFRQGLADAGFVEGGNVVVEYRWADNDGERLPRLAADLVQTGASVIVGNSQAAEAAKAITSSVPIVFVTADDPVQRDLVASLNRPGANVTGITFFGGGQLGAKRLELLNELVPSTTILAFLMDARWLGAAVELAEAEDAARARGVRLVAFRVHSVSDLDSVFDAMVKAGAGAMLIGGSPIFTEQRHRIAPMALQRRLPAISDQRDFVIAGGLASYAASFTEAYHQAGVYAGKILGGAKPAELPVLQPSRFELVVNLKTAKALGLSVPQSILLRADETVL